MIKLLSYDKDENSSIFLMYNINTTIVNSIRRIILSDYENYALNEKNIIINQNNTILHNEILRHRLSLVPINTNEEIKIELKVENVEDSIKNIYSNDLKIITGKGEIMKDILLYKLKKNKSIELTATSDKNTSKKGGIPYRPIITSYFKILKEIKYSNNISNNLKEKINKYLEKKYKLFNNKELQSNNSFGLTYELRYNNLNDIIKDFNLNKDDIYINNVYYNNIPVYIFYIESIFINPTEILYNSFNILIKNIEDFLKSNIEVEEQDNLIKLYIEDSYTLSNILSYYLKLNDKVKFAHYNKIHPLNDNILLMLYLNNQNDNYINILKKTIEGIKKYIEELKNLLIFS